MRMDNVSENIMTINKLGNNARLEWIDLLRALAMFFVVLVHAGKDIETWWIYTIFTGPIMIPLFFVISGYLFNCRGGNQKKFFAHLLKKLVFPWLFLSLIWAKAILIPVKGIEYWIESLYNVFSGKALWFMPACIVAEIIFFYIIKICKKRAGVSTAVFLCVICGFIMHYFDVGSFAMFNRALIAQAFLWCGYLFRSYQDKLLKVKSRYIIYGSLCYVFFACVSLIALPGRYIDVHKNMYPNIPLCFFMIFLGCSIVFVIASKMKMIPKFIVFLGQNTLVCYVFHGYILKIIEKIFLLVDMQISPNWCWALIETALSMTICAIVSLILNRFVPELIGKRRYCKA